MVKKSLAILVIIFCMGWFVSGCPKKSAVSDIPTVTEAEKSAAEKARIEAEKEKARIEAERKERETKEKELSKPKEDEAKKAQAQKEFEKRMEPKKTPGIEGQIFESSLLKDIRFDFDKYDIRPQDAAVLKENAALLAKAPSVKIQIEGHCDERGTIEYNLALGERRANSAKRYLVSLGIPESRVSTISYGKERPLDPAHTEDAWAKNRRAHFIILSK
jgi:peptidoglycan-associated lipoprotein